MSVFIKSQTLIAALMLPLAACADNADVFQNIGFNAGSEWQAAPPAAQLIDYSQGKKPWLDKLRALAQGKDVKFRIVQIGDSHTAGDYFTHELRQKLQARLGNGGIGWIYPNSVSGQRMATVKYSGSGWQTFSSRKDSGDFPLGGIYASSGGDITITPREAANYGKQQITFAMRPVLAQNGIILADGEGRSIAVNADPNRYDWQYVSVNAAVPFSYQTEPGDSWQVGLINLENRQRGVVLSALGINGSQLSQWSRWRAAWTQDLAQTQADLVILAYGTNEAFNKKLDLAETERVWAQTIAQIRRTLPEAGILIIGAPESLVSRSGNCGVRPGILNAVQQMQQATAQNRHTLYWSWQDAMGGQCSMKPWIAQGLGRSDGVHFSADGYRRAGSQLADALLKLAQ